MQTLPYVIGSYKPTFGFELEFATGVAEVADALYAYGDDDRFLCNSEQHRYHCSCHICGDPTVTLKLQNDSTAAGELISGVFSFASDDSAVAFSETIAAIDAATDRAAATATMSCGLHVHVGVGDNLAAYRNRMIRSYAAVEEHVVRRLAPGRWSEKRGMNATLAQSVRRYLPQADYESPDRAAQRWDRPTELIARSIQYDRHADLNFDFDRTNTVEYRMWNATMMAWRVELACRLSVVLATTDLRPTDYQLGPTLKSVVMDGDSVLPAAITWTEFVERVAATDTRCADLMEQQAAYMREAY